MIGVLGLAVCLFLGAVIGLLIYGLVAARRHCQQQLVEEESR